MADKTYWLIDLDGNRLDLIKEEAFQLVSEGQARFENQGVDWDEYCEWMKGQEFFKE